MTKKKPTWWERRNYNETLLIAGGAVAVFSMFILVMANINLHNQQPPQLNWTCAEWKNETKFFESAQTHNFKTYQEDCTIMTNEISDAFKYWKPLDDLSFDGRYSNITYIEGGIDIISEEDGGYICETENSTTICETRNKCSYDFVYQRRVAILYENSVCTREAAYCDGTPEELGTPEECNKKYNVTGFECVEWNWWGPCNPYDYYPGCDGPEGKLCTKSAIYRSVGE